MEAMVWRCGAEVNRVGGRRTGRKIFRVVECGSDRWDYMAQLRGEDTVKEREGGNGVDGGRMEGR